MSSNGVVVVNQPGVFLVDVDGNLVTAEDGAPIGSHEGILICGKDGTTIRFMRVASDGTLRIDPTGTTVQPVSSASLPLPDGAATEVTLATLATEVKLEAVRALLESLDAKDFSTETTLASLLASFNAEDFATETTLATFLMAFASEDFSSETTLASLLSAFNAEDFSTEVTLAALLTAFNAEDFASQTTLAAILSAFNAEDFASETTLAAFRSDFNAEDFATETTLASLLAAFNAGDLATETTLAAFKAAFDARDLATETTQATLATEVTLEAARVLLASLDAKDYATQTTLASILVDTGQIEALLATIDADTSNLDVLLSTRATEVTLAALRTDFNAEDFATQTTLAALLVAFNAEDFSTETTLAALKAAFDAEDFSSETTLAAILVDTGQIEALLTTIDADTSNLDVALSTRATAAAQTDGSQVAQSVGNVAHDAADSGNPVKVGGAATAAPPVAVAEGDRVDSSFDLLGRLRITDKPEVPAGSTAEGELVQGNVSGTTAVDTDYVVPDGLILTITKFLASGESGSRESKVELYHSIDAGATDGTLLAFGYIGDGGQNIEREPNSIITGSGTDVVIRLRRERLDANTRELAASWEGHQTT